MGITQVFSVSNVDRARFLAYTERKKATYAHWGNDGDESTCENEWKQETQGDEGELRSPYVQCPSLPPSLSLSLSRPSNALSPSLIHWAREMKKAKRHRRMTAK